MSFLSKLLDGFKTALPSKGKKKESYEDDFELEELDAEDKELAALSRDFAPKKKNDNDEPDFRDANFDVDAYLESKTASLNLDELTSPDYEPPKPYNPTEVPPPPEVSPAMESEIPDASLGVKPAHAIIEELPSMEDTAILPTVEESPKTEPPKNGMSGLLGKFKPKKPKKEKKPASAKPKKKNQAKGSQLAQVAILFILLGAFGYLLFGGSSKKEVADNKPSQEATQEEVAATPNPMNKKEDSIFVNPFIDSTKLAEMQKANEVNQQNGMNPVNQNPYNGSLPAIPSNYPRPNLPAFNPPSMPNNAPAPAPPATVQGVMIGSDGQGVAILSDGSVVSAGESYKDKRIAFIGGDGVHFSDGNMLEYKE